MRLLIAEKPSIVSTLKEYELLSQDIEVVYTFGIGLWRYKLPKLSFPNIPFTFPPSSLRPQRFKPRKLLLDGSGKPIISLSDTATREEHQAALDHLVNYLADKMPSYTEVICAVDCDRTGYGSANQLLERVGGAGETPIHCLYLVSTDRKTVEKAWTKRADNKWEPDSLAQQLADQQKAKQTFDYWWNANSSVVLSELCKWTGLKAEPLISKYELMLIALMDSEDRPLNVDEVMRLMDKWRGTGKYKQDGYIGIGSAMSRMAIFESACRRGALSVKSDGDKKLYALSRAGKEFVENLHKKTFDPDLPFRLDSWCRESDYAAMAKYTRTVFGRQLRHQRQKWSDGTKLTLVQLLNGNWGEFSRFIAKYAGVEPTKEKMREAFEMLPADVQEVAFKHGLSDTVFCNRAEEFLRGRLTK